MKKLTSFLALVVCVPACAAPPEAPEIGEEPAVVTPAETTLEPQDICDDCEDIGGGGGGETATPKADLAPQSTGGTACVRDAYGRLVVKVKNVSRATAAPASTTRITWHYGWSVDRYPVTDLSTESLNPGATKTFYLPIPTSCFDPHCSFTIMADATAVVVEASESNNSLGGTCYGG